MNHGSAHGRAYLSVLGWPEGAGEDERIELLVGAAGLDPYNARLAVRRGAPQVVCLIDADISGEVVGALRSKGIDAIAPMRADMEALPKARRALGVGRPKSRAHLLVVKLFGGGRSELLPGDVSAVLRATVASTKTTIDSRSTDEGMVMGATLVAGVPGAILASAMSSGPIRKSEFTIHELVEVQLVDGRRFRFDPRVATEDRAERLRPGRDRMDELALSLAEACPGAWVDRRFREFRCPPDVLRGASSVTGTKVVRTKDDGPLFEFFSAWTMLMLRETQA
ncbi:MAG: hypothetical protein K8E66_06955 [Phycisphaerales bacterium]|nr:hypothetical protein [Phycisphaerales bacterium]